MTFPTHREWCEELGRELEVHSGPYDFITSPPQHIGDVATIWTKHYKRSRVRVRLMQVNGRLRLVELLAVPKKSGNKLITLDEMVREMCRVFKKNLRELRK